MLQLLLSQGSNIPEFPDASGSLCIHHVAKVGSVLVMKYLLTQAGCNVLLPDAVGNTVLHIAVENQHPLMSEFLAEWDKRLLSIKNNQKQVPLFNPAIAETRLPFQKANASRIALNLAAVSEFDRNDETPANAFEACLTRGDVLGVERLLKPTGGENKFDNMGQCECQWIASGLTGGASDINEITEFCVMVSSCLKCPF